MNKKHLLPTESVMRRLGTPLHRQVFLVLRDRILSRRYLVGEMLPSELELVKRFNVSRTTLRYALSELERTGLVEKRHGVGTFVVHQGNTEHVRTSMTDMVMRTEEVNRSTDIELVEIMYERAPPHVQEIFKSSDTDLFQRAVRLRKLKSGKPIFCVTSYLPEQIGRAIDKHDMNESPLYDLLASAGADIVSATQEITAILSEPAVAMLLGIDVGAPLIEMDRILRDADRTPICYVEILANPIFFKLHMDWDNLTGPPIGQDGMGGLIERTTQGRPN